MLATLSWKDPKSPSAKMALANRASRTVKPALEWFCKGFDAKPKNLRFSKSQKLAVPLMHRWQWASQSGKPQG